MDLFDIAIKLEQDGAAFYLQLASNAPNEGFAEIFRNLAADEKRHESFFRSLKKKSAVVSVDSTVKEMAQEIFKRYDPRKLDPAEDQIPLYEEALALEARAIELYEKQISETLSDAQREALTKIIAEEKKHYAVLEEMITLITRPHSWVEDAEFGLREEY